MRVGALAPMTLVDPDYAEYLGREEVLATASDAAAAAKWGPIAIDTRISTALVFKADALVEAARQLAFRPGPLAVELLRVPGLHVGLIGEVVTLRAAKGGYAAGDDVFILAADETDPGDGTRFIVLRRL